MLARGFYDALPIWPTIFWPLVFSSAFYAFLGLCRLAQKRNGFSALDASSGTGALARWVYLPLASFFEVTAHFYLFCLIGWPYVVLALPIYALGWMVLPMLLDDFTPAFVVLPVVHVGFAAALLVLLGFTDIGVLRSFNAGLYGLLTGVPVVM